MPPKFPVHTMTSEPVLATIADQYGMRRVLMAVHVILGLACTALLGFTQPTTPLLVQATLLATLYYAMYALRPIPTRSCRDGVATPTIHALPGRERPQQMQTVHQEGPAVR